MNNYFQNLILSYGETIQVIFFVGVFIIAWNIESMGGIFFNYKKWRHAYINAHFIFTNIPGQILLGFAFTEVIAWTSNHQFGLLYQIPILKNDLILFVFTFCILDLGEYVYHIIMHKVKGLWKFHLVHHSDNELDVSTTLREHPGENIIRLSFTLLWVFISGAMLWVLLLRNIIQVFTTSFAHMQYRLPEKLDRLLGWIFITPNLHQVHHHYKLPYTDRNFGDVLSIWDRLFGTFKRLPVEDIKFGLDTHMNKEENCNFKALIKTPFNAIGLK